MLRRSRNGLGLYPDRAMVVARSLVIALLGFAWACEREPVKPPEPSDPPDATPAETQPRPRSSNVVDDVERDAADPGAAVPRATTEPRATHVSPQSSRPTHEASTPREAHGVDADTTTCCRVCRKGKACGDACISHDRACNKGPGCACNG